MDFDKGWQLKSNTKKTAGAESLLLAIKHTRKGRKMPVVTTKG